MSLSLFFVFLNECLDNEYEISIKLSTDKADYDIFKIKNKKELESVFNKITEDKHLEIHID